MNNQFSLDEIKKIRDLTGVGLTEAKKALYEQGDFQKALKTMQAKGLAKVDQRADRSTQAGLILSYVHDGRIGVLVEVNCETDFVARNENFTNFVKDLTLHIAASQPLYLTPQDFPDSLIKEQTDLLRQQAQNEDIKADNLAMVVKNRLQKFIDEQCLLTQPFVKEPKITVADLLKSQIAKLGENIVIQRFVRFELGSESIALAFQKLKQ